MLEHLLPSAEERQGYGENFAYPHRMGFSQLDTPQQPRAQALSQKSYFHIFFLSLQLLQVLL